MSTVISRLAESGLTLPVVTPNGRYACATLQDGWLFTAGFVSRSETGVLAGLASPGCDIEFFRRAARVCALRAIAAVAQVAELDAISRVIRVTAFIAATCEFREHSQVVDAASEVIEQAFGAQRGRHVRTAMGVASLPSGGAVELQLDAFVGQRPDSPTFPQGSL